jgi:flagellar protein FlbD
MITLTRFNGNRFVVNAELIKTVEETPDTTLTLINGDRLLVKESMEEVVRRAIGYARQIRTFAVEA